MEYVSGKCPRVSIVIIGDFWSRERNALRETAAHNTGASFADLSEIIGDKSYQSEAGMAYYLEDGSVIEVPEKAATHPGDEGMRFIAGKMMDVLGFWRE